MTMHVVERADTRECRSIPDSANGEPRNGTSVDGQAVFHDNSFYWLTFWEVGMGKWKGDVRIGNRGDLLASQLQCCESLLGGHFHFRKEHRER